MAKLLSSIFIICVYLANVNPARILGVYPFPAISHQVVFRALTLELVKRGHEVVAITPDPVYKNKQSPKNLTEIDLSDSYKLMLSMIKDKDFASTLKRGVIMDPFAVANNINQFFDTVFDYTEVKQLIKDKDQKFDLVIIEPLSYSPLIFGEIFDAPVVLFSSLYGTATQYETIGAVARHPLLYASMFRNNFKTGFFSKIYQLYQEYIFWSFDIENEISDNNIIKSQFGPNAPTVAELKKRVVLMLANAHPIFDGNRPVPPSTVYLGAVHLQPKKELPQDLKSYLDNSKRGVVYVSLGTNVRPSHMDKDFLDAFLDAFERIPYDILWKFDGDSLDRVPKNVKIQKWFPQNDLLGHQNIKLFVMQGGLQSTDEAIEAAVPLVGIPMLGDQWRNVNKFIELGIGVSVDSHTMKADDLVNAVNTVATDPSYKENMKKLRAIMRDQPEKPIDRAIWWIEHVLRHKASRHLIGPAAQTTWFEYLMLDVFIPLAFVLAILAAFATIGILFTVRLILDLKSKVKVKKH